MSIANPYAQYQQNAVQGANPGELTMMLFDGLVKLLIKSIDAIEKKDIKESHNNIIRSQEIIAHLNDTLDYRYELSKNLSALYEFMNRRLMDANIKKDTGMVEDVLGLARELRDTWQQVIKKSKLQAEHESE